MAAGALGESGGEEERAVKRNIIKGALVAAVVVATLGGSTLPLVAQELIPTNGDASATLEPVTPQPPTSEPAATPGEEAPVPTSEPDASLEVLDPTPPEPTPSAAVTAAATLAGTICGYTDVPPTSFYVNAVCWLKDENIDAGLPGKPTLFGPDVQVNRASMAVFLWKASGSPSTSPSCGFSDEASIPVEARSAACWLKARNITTNNPYNPTGLVTRAQMAAFLWRWSGSPAAAVPCGFTDVPSGIYYEVAACWLKATGITTGAGGPTTFAPDLVLNRAQIGAFLHRAQISKTGAPSTPTGIGAAAGVRSVTATWTAVPGATAYTANVYNASTRVLVKSCTAAATTTCTADAVISTLQPSPLPAFYVRVVAQNATASGTLSFNSGSVTPYRLPDVPSDVQGASGNEQAVISWRAPFDGGSPITEYVATTSPDAKTCTSTGATTCTITGLTNGKAYTVSVKARNAAGQTSASASSPSFMPDAKPLVLNYDTALSEGTTIRFYMEEPNVTVSWGDATTRQVTTTGWVTKTYAQPGKYTVSITGSAKGFGYNGTDTFEVTPAEAKLVSVTSFGALNLQSLYGSFRSASNLTSVPSTLPSSVLTITNMFRDATKFNQNISSWDTSKVKYMNYTFYGATAFNQPIGSWNTSNLLQTTYTFTKATSFNQPIANWDMSKVTSTNFMFSEATAFNQPIGNWNTASVTGMWSMFEGATAFNQPIGNWNTASVTNMWSMFKGATAFNQPIGNWNTGAVRFFNEMFRSATSFNRPLGNWNTSDGLYFSSMFSEASVFSQDLSQWCVNRAESYSSFSSMDVALHPKWGTCPRAQVPGAPLNPVVVAGDSMAAVGWSAPAPTFEGSVTGYKVTASPGGQSCTAEGYVKSCLIASLSNGTAYSFTVTATNIAGTGPASAAGSATPQVPSGSSMTLFINAHENPNVSIVFGGTPNATVDWGDGGSPVPVTAAKTESKTYATGGLYRIAISGNAPSIIAEGTELIAVTNFGSLGTTRLAFSSVSGSGIVMVPKTLPSTVTDTSTMFRYASRFNQNISSWNTANVTNMSSMFSRASAFNQPIGSWNTANVTDMKAMFQYASDFNQPIGSWNMAKVTSIASMFVGASVFNQPLNSWNTSSVTSMNSTFLYAPVFNQPLYNWNTANVTDMESMFQSANAFYQALAGWCVPKIASYPSNFSYRIPLTFAPKWGTCPTVTAPGAPAAVRVVPGDSMVAVTVAPPTNAAGLESLVSYAVTLSPGGKTCTPRPGELSCLITGLTNGTEYTATVQASNYKGTGSSASSKGTPRIPATSTSYEIVLNTYLYQSISGSISGAETSIDWGDGSPVGTSLYSKTYAPGFYTLKISGNITRIDLRSASVVAITSFGSATESNVNGSGLVMVPTTLPSSMRSVSFTASTSFNQPIGGWNTVNLTSMAYMFRGATSFNQPLNTWNTSNVKDMTSMFEGADAFNQPLDNWKTGNVKDMSYMFWYATSFNQNLTKWCVALLPTAPSFGISSTFTTSNWPKWGTCPGAVAPTAPTSIRAVPADGKLAVTWSPPTDTGGGPITSYSVTATPGTATCTSVSQACLLSGLTNGTTYTISVKATGVAGSGPAATTTGIPAKPTGTEITFAYNTAIGSGTNIALPVYFNSGDTLTINWGDGTPATAYTDSTKRPEKTYVTSGVYTVKVSGPVTKVGAYGIADTSRKKMIGITTFGTASPTSLEDAFYSSNAVLAPDVIPASATNLSYVFDGATLFNQNISGWNTSSATTMRYMFRNAAAFNQPIGTWKTGRVTDMLGMFSGAKTFNQNLSGWCTAEITAEPSDFALNSALTATNAPKWGTCVGAVKPSAPREVLTVPGNTKLAVSWLAPTASGDLPVKSYRATASPGGASCTSTAQACVLTGLTNGTPYSVSVVAISLAGESPVSAAGTGTPANPTGTAGQLVFDTRHVPDRTVNLTISTNSTAATISWGDGTQDTITANTYGKSLTHTYATSKHWTASATGGVTALTAGGDGIVAARTFGNLPLTTFSFSGAKNLAMAPDTIPATITWLSAAFAGATSFNQPIMVWNTANVTDMSAMFRGATSFNQPIGNWNMSKVTTTFSMFEDAKAFNQPLNTWNTSSVKDMSYMFDGASAFNQPIGNWDMLKVTATLSMFADAKAFNQPLAGWKTRNINTMDRMFEGANAFAQDLSGWCVSLIPTAPYAFSASSGLTLAQMPKWGTCPGSVAPSAPLEVHAYPSSGKLAVSWSTPTSDGDAPITSYTATASPGGVTCTSTTGQSCLLSGLTNGTEYSVTVKAKNVAGESPASVTYKRTPAAPTNTSATLVYSTKIGDPYVSLRLGDPSRRAAGRITVSWGDSTTSTIESGAYFTTLSHTYAAKSQYAVTITGPITALVSSENNNLVAVATFGTGGAPTELGFRGANLVMVPDSLPSSVTNLTSTFNGASSFNQNISGWNTSNVTTMYSMFRGARSFNQPIGNWNTGKVTDMSYMFYNTGVFNQNVSAWNVAAVTRYTDFRYLSALTDANTPSKFR